MSFALDTNLLMFPSTRRLFTGVAHALNRQIVVLPQVHCELTENRNIAKAEIRRWSRKLKKEGAHYQKSDAYIAAIQPMVRDWVENEFLKDSHITTRSIDQSDRSIVEDIEDSLPNIAFSGIDTAADRRLIAEAIFLDVELLGSKDSRTVVHSELNDWGFRKGYNRPLIYSPSEVLLELCGQDIETACGWVMAFNMNETDLSTFGIREEFHKLVHLVSGMGFDEVELLPPLHTFAAKLKVHLETCEHLDDAFKQSLHAHGRIRHKILQREYSLTAKVNEQLRSHEQAMRFGSNRQMHESMSKSHRQSKPNIR